MASARLSNNESAGVIFWDSGMRPKGKVIYREKHHFSSSPRLTRNSNDPEGGRPGIEPGQEM